MSYTELRYKHAPKQAPTRSGKVCICNPKMRGGLSGPAVWRRRSGPFGPSPAGEEQPIRKSESPDHSAYRFEPHLRFGENRKHGGLGIHCAAGSSGVHLSRHPGYGPLDLLQSRSEPFGTAERPILFSMRPLLSQLQSAFPNLPVWNTVCEPAVEPSPIPGAGLRAIGDR